MKHCPLIANLMSFAFLASPLLAQIRTLQPEDASDWTLSRELSELQMDPARRVELENALKAKDYKHSESILVQEAERDPKSTRAAKALVLAGGIFFLDGQYSNSVIAWKKAEAIAPLDERSRFTLAMAYTKLNRRDWARSELEKLAAAQPKNSLYGYWLARLDYDARDYTSAIAHLQKVLELDPKMMRAYDTLGLCYDYLGQFDEAIKNFHRAIELNKVQANPSPWPYVDLAVSLVSVNQLAEAEENLREAIRYDGRLPQAHYQLGRVLEMRSELQPAIKELTQAVGFAPSYPEPHLLLGRIYHRLGHEQQADAEITRYQELKKAAEPHTSAQANPSASSQ